MKLSRRSILGSVAIPFIPRFSQELTVTELTKIRRPMTVTTINGYRFVFPWHLEPGDVVRTKTPPGYNAVYVEVTRRSKNPDDNEVLFAWNFHLKPLKRLVSRSIPEAHRFCWMSISLKIGHK